MREPFNPEAKLPYNKEVFQDINKIYYEEEVEICEVI